MKKRILLLTLCFGIIFSFTACSSSEDPPEISASPTPSVEVSVSPTPNATPSSEPEQPEFINPLTGLPAETDLSGKRPVAVMINNAKKATPQVGISKADIIYECLMEGGYTRLMCLFQDYGAVGEIGSVRSARDYFIDFAQNHDAIYIHAGGSPQAYINLKERDIDHVDGVNGYIANTFYRDEERRKTMGYEHSLMIDAKGIQTALEKKKFRLELKERFVSPLQFGKEPFIPQGEDAGYVKIKYSGYITGEFDYDKQSGKYLRSQFGKAHIDGATGETLAFDNLIILFLPHSDIKGDEAGRIAVATTGSGNGYYVYGGKAMEIRWKKSSRDSAMVLSLPDGSDFSMNPGKTFVSIASEYARKNMKMALERSTE
jgi:hypothetical protein